jgi:hypothetical protein
MIIWAIKIVAALLSVGSFFLANREEIIKSGDVDSVATVTVMVLLIGHMLGAKVGKIIYWVIAVYLVIYVTA